jgi:hypothetical protein
MPGHNATERYSGGPGLPGPPCCTSLSLLEVGLAEPFLESDLAEPRLAGGNQRALAELGAEVPRVRVDDNLAGVVVRCEALTDQLIETELLRTRNAMTADSSNDGELETTDAP